MEEYLTQTKKTLTELSGGNRDVGDKIVQYLEDLLLRDLKHLDLRSTTGDGLPLARSLRTTARNTTKHVKEFEETVVDGFWHKYNDLPEWKRARTDMMFEGLDSTRKEALILLLEVIPIELVTLIATGGSMDPIQLLLAMKCKMLHAGMTTAYLDLVQRIETQATHKAQKSTLSGSLRFGRDDSLDSTIPDLVGKNVANMRRSDIANMTAEARLVHDLNDGLQLMRRGVSNGLAKVEKKHNTLGKLLERFPSLQEPVERQKRRLNRRDDGRKSQKECDLLDSEIVITAVTAMIPQNSKVRPQLDAAVQNQSGRKFRRLQKGIVTSHVTGTNACCHMWALYLLGFPSSHTSLPWNPFMIESLFMLIELFYGREELRARKARIALSWACTGGSISAGKLLDSMTSREPIIELMVAEDMYSWTLDLLQEVFRRLVFVPKQTKDEEDTSGKLIAYVGIRDRDSIKRMTRQIVDLLEENSDLLKFVPEDRRMSLVAFSEVDDPRRDIEFLRVDHVPWTYDNVFRSLEKYG